MSEPRLKISMIGQRGVPARFGGVERVVEELGARLAARHDVTVYCRPGYVDDTDGQVATDEHRGMTLRWVRTIQTKHLEAIVHSVLCSLDVVRRRPDIVHYHALGPGVGAIIPRTLARGRVVQTIHGLDDERPKWGRRAQTLLRLSRWMSLRVPDAIAVVSTDLKERFERDGARGSVHLVPNGVEPVIEPPDAEARRSTMGVKDGPYLLFVGRLVPEKQLDVVLDAVGRLVGRDLQMVVAGGSSHSDDYTAGIRAAARADQRILLLDYVYGDDLAALFTGAAALTQVSSLEGMPLVLLEAMSAGIPVIVSDIPPHLEAVGDVDVPVVGVGDVTALATAIEAVLDDPERYAESGRRLRDRVMDHYTWDAAAAAQLDVYRQVTGRRRRRRSWARIGRGRP